MPIVIIYVIGGLTLWLGFLTAVALWLGQRGEKAPHYHPKPSELMLEIYAYLTLEKPDKEHPLLTLRPTHKTQQELARILVELRRNIAECHPERVGELARAWRLDFWLQERIATSVGTKRLEALEMLLYLHPTAACAERIRELELPTRAATFGQMLIVIYTKPSQVAFYLKHHPYLLSWKDVERVVEVLHMRSPILSPPKVDGVASCNVEMLLLYLAHIEGVGNPLYEAERLTRNPNRTLRTAAFNVLLGEALYPTSQMGSYDDVT